MVNEKQNRLYGDLAYLWPIISPPEDYEREAGFWRDLLRSRLGSGTHEILELGVGGGHNLSHLTGDFEATAVDLSPDMLDHCRRLNPGVRLHVGDMRTVRLEKAFRAVLIHDAIGHMLTEDDLRQAFATAAAHLEPGGIFVTSPDHFLETFRSPQVEHVTRSQGEMEVTYFEYQWNFDPRGTAVEVLMFYLIRTPEGLRVERDRHLLGLFPLTRWLDLMREAGFVVEKVPYPIHGDGREAFLLVGTRKP